MASRSAGMCWMSQTRAPEDRASLASERGRIEEQERMSAQRTAIVFSCDEKYVPLAKGLVLSLADGGVPNADLSLVLIDIGCGPNSLTWMRDRGVEIVPFDPAPNAPAVLAVIKPHQRAQ